MTIKNLSKYVYENTLNKRDFFEREFKAKEDEIFKSKTDDLISFEKKTIEKNRREKELYERVQLSTTNKKVLEEINKKKKEITQKIKLNVKKKILNLTEDKLEDLFEKILKKASSQIDIYKISLSSKDYKIVKKFISSSIKVIQDDKISGFAFSNKDETNLVRITYEDLANNIVDENYDLIYEEF